MEDTFIKLGKSNILISRIGLGTMQWGFKEFSSLPESEIKDQTCKIYQTSIEMGINFFDTAEVYGKGKSEERLGICYRDYGSKVVIASKFMPYPWRLSRGMLRSALKKSLNRLDISKIDLYQMHWPFPPISINTWMDEMADVVSEGLIEAVGVSNYSLKQTQKAFDRLKNHGIPLVSNQVKYNLLDRKIEKRGLLRLCNELGVTVIAYSPLEIGILTGKYRPDNLPSGYRSWRYNKSYLNKISPLMTELKQLGAKHGDKSPSQVSLNWLICKGAVPIPGAKNVNQAKDNSGALGWRLTDEDVDRLDQISDAVIKK